MLLRHHCLHHHNHILSSLHFPLSLARQKYEFGETVYIISIVQIERVKLTSVSAFFYLNSKSRFNGRKPINFGCADAGPMASSRANKMKCTTSRFPLFLTGLSDEIARRAMKSLERASAGTYISISPHTSITAGINPSSLSISPDLSLCLISERQC